MAKTKIEWCDYSVNPVKGLCPMACPYCYARRMYKRFKWDETIRLDLDAFQFLTKVKTPSRIFVGSTMELFGDWVLREWMIDIFSLCDAFKQHTFIFLTKQPQNIYKWSPFPDNCWVGVSVPNEFVLARDNALTRLDDVQAKVKFISFEPLQSKMVEPYLLDIGFKIAGINWLIIGQQTPPNAKTSPKIEWVREIVQAADKVGIPVFLKNNLYPVVNSTGHWEDWCSMNFEGYGAIMRQEFPKVGLLTN